jgi:N-acetyl-anhydromuramyl-L-alanine amidase AmpD
MAGDFPGVPFVQARYYSKGRTGPLKWIVMHTMEAHETGTTAENTANYFANPGDGRTVSSHLCVDNNSVVQCVLEKDTAYTAGGNPGNPQGFNVEQAGFARQTRADWLDDYSMSMFYVEAPVLQDVALRYGIPFKYVNWEGLRAGQKGFTTHNDCRLAWGGTSHTDPGSNFPWDVFLPIVEGGGGMTPQQWEWLQNLSRQVKAMCEGKDTAAQVKYNSSTGNYDSIASLSLQPFWDRVNLASGGGGGGGGITPDEVLTIVRGELDNTRLTSLNG